MKISMCSKKQYIVKSLDISTNLKTQPPINFGLQRQDISGETGRMVALLKVIYDTFIGVEIVLNVRSLFQRSTFYNGGGKNVGMLKKYPPPLKATAAFSNLLY
jgi:hypothetical protein